MIAATRYVLPVARRPWAAIAAWIITRRLWVMGAWIVVAALLIPRAARVEKTLDVAARVPGSESARVEQVIATRFSSGFAQYAVLVITGGASPITEAGRTLLERVRADLAESSVVTRAFSWLDVPDTLFIGQRGETFVIVGLDANRRRPDDLIPVLRDVTARISESARGIHPDISLMWTGEIALNYDLRQVSAADARQAERRVLPLTLLLLMIAFGAVAASLLPLVAGGLAIALALGASVAIAGVWPLSILLQNVVTMLGLGLGIDYALLVVGRFRESLASGRSHLHAARASAEHAGHTILLSGASVAIGFAALLLVPVNEVRSIAVGGLLVVATSVVLSVTLLPGMLAMLGPRVNWGRVVKRHEAEAGAKAEAGAGRGGSARWRRWGMFVCSHPILVLIAAGAPTALLALQSTRLNTDLPRGDWLPAAMESSRGLHALERMQRSGIVNSVRVLVELPAGAPWDSPAGWNAVRTAGEKFFRDPRVARVRSLSTATGFQSPNLQLIAALPPDLRGSLVSTDGRSALIEVMPAEAAAQHGAMDIVRELRSRPGSSLTGLAGSSIQVGGLPAFNVDYEAAIGDRFWSVVAAVVGVTMLALLIGFRSLLIAVKAVALNLLSVAAAFGAVVLVFQDGMGIHLVGMSSPLDGTFTAIPVIVFCVVFGLSMDYEVFLVARIAEARRNGLADAEAIAEGMARTGGLITSAAAIMIVVFAAFTLGDFVIVKILGLALGVAVLVDATVVRMAIGPALFRLAGRWNWWPGERTHARAERSLALQVR
ncbi:MAG: MMPL family transporter [Gemmatimonadaceae bacterium]|nr:MMPL family transporter [Gemmatimonadaceae bacterium]